MRCFGFRGLGLRGHDRRGSRFGGIDDGDCSVLEFIVRFSVFVNHRF